MKIRLVELLLACAIAVVCVVGLGWGEEFKCTKDFDCKETEVCNKKTGVCEPLVCFVDEDCVDPDQSCDNNACVSKSAQQ